jgi:hypothetical protein
MGWIIWGIVLPCCALSSWLIIRRPLREVVEELRFDQGRLQFRLEREWLEARFLSALAKLDPLERDRWEGASWQDRVHWARDHQTRGLIALVEVQFEADSFETSSGRDPDHATALFEYRRGRWLAEGKRLDATHPDEAFLPLGRFEPVARPPRRG